jgi:hypothetical protein
MKDLDNLPLLAEIEGFERMVAQIDGMLTTAVPKEKPALEVAGTASQA